MADLRHVNEMKCQYATSVNKDKVKDVLKRDIVVKAALALRNIKSWSPAHNEKRLQRLKLF